MKRLFGSIILITAIFIFQHNALAQEPLKIGVVNIETCIANSNEWKKKLTSLQTKQTTMQAELNQKQEELLQMQQEIEKQSLMLSLDAQENKQKEYDKKRRDLEYLAEDLNDELDKAQTEAENEILVSIHNVIVKIAMEDNYDLILETGASGTLFATESLDITKQVIEEHNKATP